MSQYVEQKELFDKVLYLKEEERQDECRHHLWTMVETCLTTDNTGFSDAEERGNLLLHYRDLERLLEANVVLLDKRGRRTGPPKGIPPKMSPQ